MIHAEPETKSLQVLEKKKKDEQEVVQEYFKYCVKSRRRCRVINQVSSYKWVTVNLFLCAIPSSEF